ncbi:MAG: hypothetical protein LBQ58_10175 [Synergistaceae bacterium]|jgi:hypothetical protein|nr:hypothetical protein [Synergistaceae bacterium]
MKRMKFAVSLFSPFIVLFCVMTLSVTACAAPSTGGGRKYEPFIPTDPIMPLSQVKPGMKGECRTVIRGSDIVTFKAEVLDVIPNSGVPANLIFIRASGPVIDQTGGIAAGMSGSPFYIDGKLVGAIGYGWHFSRHDMGLVTPIEDMIEIWNNPEIIPSFDPAPIVAEKPPSAASDDKELDWERILSRDITGSETGALSLDILTPSVDSFAGGIFISGLSQRMADKIGGILGKEVFAFGGGGSIGDRPKMVKYDAKLKPGMAMGASLAWGDVEIGAIGTLTAVAHDGRFVAFAHPFMDLGPTAAVLTEARISGVIPGLSSPFKIGTTGDIIGIVTQDRPQGIGGRIGRFAPAAGCNISLTDVDSGRTYKRGFQVVQDKYLITNLIGVSIVGCIENLWGRSGGGSAKITATYSGSALPGGWKRTNVFVSETDVASEMLKEFNLLTQVLSVNQFQELRPFGVDVEVEVTQEPRVLYIEDVVVPKGVLHPGERVSFDITLRPWRKDPYVRTYSLVVPKNVTGIAELLVRGGGIGEENAEYMEAGWRSISSLPILLNEVDAKETNDQIVIEIRGQEALADQIKRSQNGNPEDLMNDKLKSEIRQEKMDEGSMRIIRTNYYVDGLIQKLISVDGSSNNTDDSAGEPEEAAG